MSLTDSTNYEPPTTNCLVQQRGHESRNKIIAAFLALLIMSAFVAGLAMFKKNQIATAIKQNQSFQMPPDAVTSIVAEPQPWDPVLQAVGSLSAAQGVMLSADLPGVVMKTPLKSGMMVKKGDLLVQLDTRQEEAQLRMAQSKLALAQIKIERATDLAAKNVIAKSALDDVRAEYDGAVAAVDEIKAVISRKTLTAPFDGMLGLCQINEGQYLKSGDPIVALNLLDVIHVNFSLPQQNIGQLTLNQPVRVTADGIPHETFQGTITAINSEVDTTTRNIQVQATIINDKLVLRGGMFAKIDVLLPTRTEVITLPVSSINYAPYGDSVFVIEKIKKLTNPRGASYLGVREQPVTLGATRGDQVEILTGLKAGDEVVSSGVFKLRPGCAVKVNNTVQPGNNAAPKPLDS